LREAFERGDRALLKELAASGDIDRYPPSTVVLLAHALAQADARGSALEVLRKAQRQHPEDVWMNLALADSLSEEVATRGEAIGFCRAALACRPHSLNIHFFLGHTLQEQGKAREATEVLRRAVQLKPDSAWAHLLLGDALGCLDKLPEALAEYRRAVQLKPRLDPLPPSDADWFRRAERLVELDDRLSAVLRGEAQPRDAAERAEFAFVCRFRDLNAASARLYGEAFAQQPDLTEQHRYDAAWAAVLAGTGNGTDAGGLDERARARLRGQALIWLRGELEIWRQHLGKEPARFRAEDLPRINCWLGDPDLACLRDPEPLSRLPVAERGDWENLWRDLRELLASARTSK
jgi:hypothetical protein